MAIYSTEDKKELIVTCMCGCQDAMQIKLFGFGDDYIIASYLNGNWYRDQNNSVFAVIKAKWEKIWSIIKNKDYYYSEIVMDKDDFKRFKDYINQF